jgi:hypothetical protein
MRILVILLIALTASIAHARGNESGGGGDEIRADFMKWGVEVIVFLANDPSGQGLADFHHLDINELEKTLTIERISVTDDQLMDRTGSIVDAVVRDDKLLLNQTRWLSILRAKEDAHYLVFHEMLRLGGVDDDDYRISKGFREALSRRTSLSPDTQSVSVVCSDSSQKDGRVANQIIFSRRHDEAANFSFSFAHSPITQHSSGNMQTIVRLGTDGFHFSNSADRKHAYVDLIFNSVRSMATVTYIGYGNSLSTLILPCAATASTLVRSSVGVALPLAIDYVAEGM